MANYKALLKELLSDFTDSFRKCRKLTQEQMAEFLRISGRAYGDLERGICCFSAPSLLFLLSMLSDEEIKALLALFLAKVSEMESMLES